MATARNSKLASKDLSNILTAGALPGETDGFTRTDKACAVAISQAALDHARRPAIVSETGSDAQGRRIMRIAIANDDMPFLVDSVAAAVAAHGVATNRILHPVVDAGTPTSLIYLETERPDAKSRKALIADIETNLAHVRAAVTDWPAMEATIARDARTLGDSEGAALMFWLLDGNLTLLGSAQFGTAGKISNPLGIARQVGDALLSPEARKRALTWLDANPGPLIVKSNFISTVHRRAPLDLFIMKTDAGMTVHAGLWTSAALAAAPEVIPVLRARLAMLQAKYGFAPDGHAGKSLAHALTALPHDLLVSIAPEPLERLALTAMSLADRPRPELVLAEDALERHLFAFVWLPRDDLSTARRTAIADMLGDAADADLLSWSVDMGDSGVALIRYTFDRRQSARDPDADALRRKIEAMVRGWEPSVEASLAKVGDSGRAARLAIRYAAAFPIPYRSGAGPDEAALDIVRLHGLADDTARNVRLYRNAEDGAGRLRLKLYSLAPVILSDAVPALENFGFRVVEEMSTALNSNLGHMHRFVLDLPAGSSTALLARADVIEAAIAATVADIAEDDRFNELLISADIGPRDVILFRALFRYLRQTGMAYSLTTVGDALRRQPAIARALITFFAARHDPAYRKGGEDAERAAEQVIERALTDVAAIDDDRILRRLRAVIRATLRTNFFMPGASEAIAFKFDSAQIPGLPAPVPWREIWVYSPRVEGIHLRAGPIARGGLRWSDRRDDFRTEILGLMKAQRVKNAVIVPTGAKGGFYPKCLPDAAVDRAAWLAEGTESYRIFIRTLLSITDNIVDGKVVHPLHVVIHDGEDPYFVVAADKGTATFSDVANAIAIDRQFWLGDAFASGGSVGYDHKAMGITAKGAWLSVQRHFAEAGVDVQNDPVVVVGCGDMSGDVFGNGMLLSKSLKLVAAYDHRHIFLDPEPDPAKSWDERTRMFALPRSSWADYNPRLISKGGGVFARSEKSIKLSKEVRAVLGIDAPELEPAALISAILKSPADLIWFGGIGTYVKAASEAHGAVGDPANDGLRVDAEDLRAKVIGEGANLGVTQAARIAFGMRGGRINTDFIDNSAGVDCSDHEVNIKIALNAEVANGTLTMPGRNKLLAKMTGSVAALVLEDNRLQTLALSIAQRGGASAVPSHIRLIETFETAKKLDRAVEGLLPNDILTRRAQDGLGLTRPELAVLLATAKLALQDAIEHSDVAHDPAMTTDLLAAFPPAMAKSHGAAIENHQLRGEIVATKIANRLINRLGLIHPFELAEEEGAALGDIAAAFVIVEQLYALRPLWDAIDSAEVSEGARLMLFEQVAMEARAQMADLLRNAVSGRSVGDTIAALTPGVSRLATQVEGLLHIEARAQASDFSRRLGEAGAPARLVDKIVRLAEMDGAIGLAALGNRTGTDVLELTRAFVTLGAALGLDWAQGVAMRQSPIDPWERLLISGLARDFETIRLDFLMKEARNPEARVAAWIESQAPRIAQFRALIDRARMVAVPSGAMLAQIAGQARVLLAR